jgi:hypothetical protein
LSCRVYFAICTCSKKTNTNKSRNESCRVYFAIFLISLTRFVKHRFAFNISPLFFLGEENREKACLLSAFFFVFRLYTSLVRLRRTSIRRLISVQVCALFNGLFFFLCCVKSHPLCFVSVAFPYLFFSVLHSVIQRSFTLSVAQRALDRFYHFSRRRFRERIFYISINFFPKRNILGIKDQRDRGKKKKLTYLGVGLC